MKYASLSPRCPIGFSFSWDGDCPGQQVKTWRFVRRDGVLPLFASDDGEARWSSRLETVAQAAYMANLSERRAPIADVVREHLSCACSDTQRRQSELVTALELRETSVKFAAQREALEDLQRRMTAECGA